MDHVRITGALLVATLVWQAWGFSRLMSRESRRAPTGAGLLFLLFVVPFYVYWLLAGILLLARQTSLLHATAFVYGQAGMARGIGLILFLLGNVLLAATRRPLGRNLQPPTTEPREGNTARDDRRIPSRAPPDLSRRRRARRGARVHGRLVAVSRVRRAHGAGPASGHRDRGAASRHAIRRILDSLRSAHGAYDPGRMVGKHRARTPALPRVVIVLRIASLIVAPCVVPLIAALLLVMKPTLARSQPAAPDTTASRSRTRSSCPPTRAPSSSASSTRVASRAASR